MLGSDPGAHELTFTHCVRLEYETRVRDDVWSRSWSDEFVDYQAWLDAGEPDGYVWGTDWSSAYPGRTRLPLRRSRGHQPQGPARDRRR